MCYYEKADLQHVFVEKLVSLIFFHPNVSSHAVTSATCLDNSIMQLPHIRVLETC